MVVATVSEQLAMDQPLRRIHPNVIYKREVRRELFLPEIERQLRRGGLTDYPYLFRQRQDGYIDWVGLASQIVELPIRKLWLIFDAYLVGQTWHRGQNFPIEVLPHGGHIVSHWEVTQVRRRLDRLENGKVATECVTEPRHIRTSIAFLDHVGEVCASSCPLDEHVYAMRDLGLNQQELTSRAFGS